MKKDQRFLGIDFGQKRVGVSMTDQSGSLAFPHSTLKNSERLVDEIERICKDEGVSEIVIGESKDFKGKDNLIMPMIKKLKQDLEGRLKIEVSTHPEFLTTVQARKSNPNMRGVDASASAIMLQSYLDSKK